MTIGECIRAQRKARGMTQQELGDAIGTHQGNISYYESGVVIPTIFNLLSIADALDCSLDDLVGRKFPKEEHHEKNLEAV